MLCFVVVMQSFIINSHEVFIHINQGCFAGTGAIIRLPQCQLSKSDGYGRISQCITTTKHSKAKTVCIFLGIYCTYRLEYKVLVIARATGIPYCSILINIYYVIYNHQYSMGYPRKQLCQQATWIAISNKNDIDSNCWQYLYNRYSITLIFGFQSPGCRVTIKILC